MESERFVERILETENLTDELEDTEAQHLLDWGLAELGPLLADEQDAEIAGGKVNQLMAVMRKINRLLGALPDRTAESVAQELALLDELIHVIRPLSPAATPAECSEAATILTTLDTPGALDFILAWRSSPSDPPTEVPAQE